MAAYRADIEIGVRGVRYLDELQNKLTQVSKTIEQVNKQQVVIRRTIAGAASAVPMGPGGAGVTGASAQAAALAVERRVSQMRRDEAQAQLKAVKDRAFAENYISGIINRRVQAKQQELAIEQKISTEQQKQAAANLRSRVSNAASNAIIGGAFPLLFGQGLGAAVGGGVGGAAGGMMGGQFGFGLSLVGTALGQAFDTFTKAAVESGQSLRDPITNFKKLADAGLLASRSQQKYIEQLIEAGKTTEAVALIQDEIIKKIGVKGTQDLQTAGAASDKLSKALAEFSLQAQAAVSGPLAAMLSWLASVVAIGNNVNRTAAQQTDIMGGLSAADQASLRRQEQQILQGANLFNESQKRQQVNQLYQSYAPRANIQRPGTSVDPTAQNQAQGQTKELQAQVELEAKKLTLVGMSLEKNGQAYVEAAKAVALQEYENSLLEIKNSWIGKAYDAERNQAMIRLANLQYAGKLKAIDAERVKAGRDELEIRKAILGLEAELIQTTFAAGDLDIEREKTLRGESAAIKEELGQLQARLNLEARVLDLQTQQKLLAKDLTARERELIDSVYKQQLANLTSQSEIRQKILQQTLAQKELEQFIADSTAVNEAKQPFTDMRTQRELDIQYGKTYLRLVTEGILPAEAERLANFDRFVAEQLKSLDIQIAIAQSTLDQANALQLTGDALKTYVDNLERLKKVRAAVTGQAILGPVAGQTREERAAAAIAQIRGELNELADPVNAAVRGANAIGDAFQQAFTGLMTGAMTAQETLASFFRSVGEAFISMAAEIIAKQMVMITLQSILKALGLFGGGGGGSAVVQGVDVPVAQMPAGMAFAEGGFVTGPTNALIGEGGEPEYVIPASKMRTAMARYSAGARGTAVIPANGGAGDGPMGELAAAPGTIDVRYTVERINSVDYVTADQFRAGMQEAAAKGAAQGEQRTLRRLQNSTSTRRRLGM